MCLIVFSCKHVDVCLCLCVHACCVWLCVFTSASVGVRVHGRVGVWACGCVWACGRACVYVRAHVHLARANDHVRASHCSKLNLAPMQPPAPNGKLSYLKLVYYRLPEESKGHGADQSVVPRCCEDQHKQGQAARYWGQRLKPCSHPQARILRVHLTWRHGRVQYNSCVDFSFHNLIDNRCEKMAARTKVGLFQGQFISAHSSMFACTDVMSRPSPRVPRLLGPRCSWCKPCCCG